MRLPYTSALPVVSALVLISIAPWRSDAANPVNQVSRASESRAAQTEVRSSTEAAQEQRLAREWGLKLPEWARYRQLMQGPLGVYSPALDPLTALGIEARSDEERRRYAELQVRMEGQRVEKILAYQRAYDDAWKRLHPRLQPVALPESATGARSRANTNIVPNGRVAVFVKEDCVPCEQRVKQLQSTGRPFDIYMVGTLGDDTRIRRWAARVGVDPAKVRSRLITLNHDAGQWLVIGGRGALPAVVREFNGRWQRE